VKATYQYHAFGQVIASEFPIDVLEPAPDCAPTIEVKLAEGLRDESYAEDPAFEIAPDRQRFHWAAVGAFEITESGCILVEPYADIPWRLVSQPLLGIVISVALERLGLFCLHGGSVDVNGRAAIVLGDKGAGKSTTVSSLLGAGHQLLTDDLVAIDCTDTEAQGIVQTGFPAVKLWPDSAEALAVNTTENSELIHPTITKIQKQLDASNMAKPKPADAIFVLAPSQTGKTYAEELPAATALEALLYFAFIARFGNTSLGPQHLGHFMRRCCHVVKTARVYRLNVHRDFGRLDDLVAEIEKHVTKPEAVSA
jgi:hypothetical protein